MTALPDADRPGATVASLLAARVRLTPDDPAARYWHEGAWHMDSWRTLARRVSAVAAALARHGMSADATLGMFLPTGYPFVLADLATLTRGWQSACYHPAWQRAELKHALLLTRPALILVPVGARQLADEAIADAGLSAHVWVVVAEDGVSFSSSFAAASAPANVSESDAASSSESEQRAMTIAFTSGTNGPAKGVVIAEEALIRVAARSYNQVGYLQPHATTLHWLPLSHLFGRLGPLLDIIAGSAGGYCRSIDQLADDIAEIRPHVLMAVPHFLDRARRNIEAGARGGRWRSRTGFRIAHTIGRGIAALPLAVRLPAQRLLRRSLFRQLQAWSGSRLDLIIVGGAPVSTSDVTFFEALGIAVRVGFGMTETTGVASVQPYRRRSSGCGFLLPGIEMRIGAGGTLLLRGDSLLSGYLGAQAFDDDGWFDTGDLARIGGDGSLHLLGRTKDIVIPRTGENVNPTQLELRLTEHPLIGDACIVGDGQPAIAALIVLSSAGMNQLRQAGADAVRRAVGDHVAALNGKLPRYERITGFQVLSKPFSVEAGELNISLKKRRSIIAARRSFEIDACYEGQYFGGNSLVQRPSSAGTNLESIT